MTHKKRDTTFQEFIAEINLRRASIAASDKEEILDSLELEGVVVIAAFLLQEEGQKRNNLLVFVLVQFWQVEIIQKNSQLTPLQHPFAFV